MILWKGKEWSEAATASTPMRTWRWIIEADLFCSRRWFGASIEYAMQVKFPDSDWRHINRYYSLGMNLMHWRIGQFHMWYDGPHCVYSFGPIHYSCGPLHCEKCYAPVKG